MEAYSYPPLNNFLFSEGPSSPQLYDDNFLQPWSDVQNQQYKLFNTFSSDVKIQNLDSDPKLQSPIYVNPTHSNTTTTTIEVKAETDTKTTTSRSRKKRKRTEDDDVSGDISFVTLSRDELLEMSSQELEDRVKLLQQQRPLSTAEKEEIQRQRKLIKNREYAQTSRLKKRETLTTLKGRLEEVSAQNVILQTQVNHLSQRNRELELENQQLRVLWTHQTTQTYIPTVPMTTTYPVPTSLRLYSPGGTTPSPSYSETGSHPSSPSTDDYDSLLGSITSDSDDAPGSFSLDVPLFPTSSPIGQGGGWGLPDPYASLCLLVILFSFGLFFNWGGGSPRTGDDIQFWVHLPKYCTYA